MGDFDRDRERVRETDRTTTIVTGDGGRRGNGVLIAVILLIALLALLFFLFSGNLNRAADEVGVNIDVETPKIETPEIKVPDTINVDVPEKIEVGDVELSTEGSNKQ